MKHHVLSLGALVFSVACGGDVRTTDAGAAGGPSSGAAPGSGGQPGTGGGQASGGRPGTGGNGAGGSPSSGGAGGSPSSGGAGGGCATPCNGGAILACCAGACVNMDNDPHHCGGCGVACPSSKSLCLNGHCVVPTCADPILPDAAPPPACAPGTTCCGTGCCTGNEICCNVERGGPSGLPGTGLGCVDPSKSNGTCPIGCPLCVCASPDTAIATPAGDRAIATLAVGDLVYSVDHGEVRAVPVAMVHRNPARAHHVIRIELEGGSTLEISAPHPTADGRHFGDLHRGDSLDGKRILSATVIPYAHAFTFDILPASDSGTYVAGGALIGSTLGGSALSLAESPMSVSVP